MISESAQSYLDSNNFDGLLDLRIRLKRQEDAIRENLAVLNLELMAMMKTAEIQTAEVEFNEEVYLISMVDSMTGERIDKKALLEYGVDPVIIQQATVSSKPRKPFLNVQLLSVSKEVR